MVSAPSVSGGGAGATAATTANAHGFRVGDGFYVVDEIVVRGGATIDKAFGDAKEKGWFNFTTYSRCNS